MPNLSPFSLAMEVASKLFASDMEEPVRRVEAFVKAMEPIHRVYERQWYLNIANIAGNQWLTYDPTGRRFFVPPAPSWRVRLIVNKILPIARIQMAKLAENRKSFHVIPEDSDNQMFVMAAKAGSRFIDSIRQGEDFNSLEDELDSWLVSCGLAYIFVGYDGDDGLELEEVVKDEEGQPVVNPVNGKPVVRKFKTGDLVLSLDTPFEVIPDYSSIRWSEQFAVCRRKLRSVQYVKEKYGVEVKPESLQLEFGMAMRAAETATMSSGKADLSTVLSQAVIVKDYYEMPSDEYPKGRHIIVAGGKKLFEGELKVKYKGKLSLPTVPYTAIKIAGRLMPMSPIEPLLPLQWEYNKTRSAMIEDDNLMGRPKILVPLDSVANDVITDQPGERIEYDPQIGAPAYMLPPPVNNGRVEKLTRLEAEMMEIGGVHDISMGRLPRRATSGFALSILDEKDHTVMLPILESKAHGHQKLFSMALAIAEEEFIESRQLKILGTDGKSELASFIGADIGGQHDVRVVPDDPFPTSRSAKLEFAKELAQAGIISPRTIRRMLGLSGFSELDDTLLDEEDQRIKAMAQAQAAQAQQQMAGPSPEDIAAAIQEQGGLTAQGGLQ